MAITQTYLTADLSATDHTMTVNSGTGFPAAGSSLPFPNYLVRIDKEYLLAVSQPTAGTIKLGMRGVEGTVAAAHDTGAKVEVSALPSDFSWSSPGNEVSLPPYLSTQETIGEDITYSAGQVSAWGNQPREFAITKASAAAIGLGAPSKGQDGLELTFTSLTAAAHVITATSLLGDAVSGSPHTTATAGAYTGATLVLKAENGIYNVKSAVGWTIT